MALPVVYAGEALMRRLLMTYAHIAVAILFATVGVVRVLG